jgi:hypothetical protein
MSQIPPPPMPPSQAPDPHQGPNSSDKFQRGAQEAVTAAKAAAQDAFKVFMQLIYNPVGAMPGAFASLNPNQAMAVGGVFAAVFTLCLLFGGSGMAAMAGLPIGSMSSSLGFKGFLVLLLTSFGFAAGVAAGNYLTRLALKGQGSLSFDIFSGGASLLPLGLGLLATAILSMVGISGAIGSVPTMIGGCLMVLVLFTGLTRVANINEGPASYSVGAILVVGTIAAYLIGRMCVKVFYGI